MSTQKIQTSFGLVTIFKKKSDQKLKVIDAKEITDGQQETQQSEESSLFDNRAVKTNENQNFFGLEETKQTNESNENENDNLNYIDQQLLDGYKNEANSSTNNINKSLTLEETDLNFVDKYYFSKNKNTNEEKRSKPEDITKAQLENTSDLNYIDRMTFEANDIDDKSIGSIISLKKTEEKIKFNEKIPLVIAKNIADDEESNAYKFKDILRNNESKRIKDTDKINSNHKLIDSEVPKWHNLTIDDATLILKNHICYMNQEEGLLAIDKPYGLPSIGGSKVHLSVDKLLPSLQELLKLNTKLFMAHRLDEYTTGVMLFATEKAVSTKLQSYFSERKVLKQYLAITRNIPKIREGEIDIPLIRRKVNNLEKTYLSPEYNEYTRDILDRPSHNGERKKSITKYRVLDSANQAALIELQPLTGFQHQIRAHLAFGLDCPILGDHKYSHNVKMAPQKLPDEMLRRLDIRQTKVRYVPMHLHAYQIILPEFKNNSNVFIKAKLPLHFLNNLKRLKLRF